MKSVYDVIRQLGHEMARQNMGWPKELVVEDRVFRVLVAEAHPHEMQREVGKNGVTSVTIALDYGPCIVRPG